MKLRISLSIVLIGMIIMLANHLLLDWRSITIDKTDTFLDYLIDNQKNDLLGWLRGETATNDFQKRKFCEGELTEWSDDRFWPILVHTDSIYVTEDSSGIYLIQVVSQDENCVAISSYPLAKSYSITNRFLKSGVRPTLPENLVSISTVSGTLKFRNLLYYEIKETPSKAIDVISGILIIVFLLIIFWNFLTKKFLFSIFILLVVRGISLFFGVLEGFINYPLFDAIYYTSSIWNPTLGDLFLNCLLIFIISLSWSRKFRVKSKVHPQMLIYLYALIGLMMSVSVLSVVWSILDNSQISMDVGKSIEFGLLRIIAYSSVILIVGSQFLITFRLIGLMNSMEKKMPVYLFILSCTVLLLVFSKALTLVGLLYTFVVFIASKLKWGVRLKEFKYENLQFVLVISLTMAGVLAVSVYTSHEKAELDAKRKFANHLLIKKDVLGEYYLNQMLRGVRDGCPEGGTTEYAKEEMNMQLLNTYFDKYEVNFFDPVSDSLNYYNTLITLTEDRLSDYEDIYFLIEDTDIRYVCKIGQLLITLELKKRVPTSVFPALLAESKYFTPSDNFDYAIFKNGQILSQHSKFGQGEWPETEDFLNPKLFDAGIEKNGRHYYGVNTVDGRVILIISKKYGRRMQLTNFSFFFLINLFFIGSIVLLSSLNFKETKLSFTGKIQLYLGLAFIVPLVSSGFALLNSLNTSYKEEINRNYLKRSLYISELLSHEVADSTKEITFERLAEIRDITQADLSLYDKKGKLLSTSQNAIFELGLQSELINPVVFEELVQKENQGMIAEKSIGTLDYKVSYATLGGSNDELVGFIAMPFFDSKNHLKRQQLEVFGSLISIFGFLFMVAIFFGNLVLNNLLNPLRMVADKIRKITLQEENKPILYESSDEIGSLVRDYNYMLVKLEQSKTALARSQKETAWKEIARQVAHEIKNPLTPMQLKIQQLLRKHEEGSKDHDTLSALLIQVDTLSQIAGSFSAFAEMPAPHNSLFDLSKLLRQVIGLYQNEEINVQTAIEDVAVIYADKDTFQRILNNIVLNAIQAVHTGDGQLGVRLVKKIDKCELSISDNGQGVPDEVKDKIFLKYFSTKSEGSGIGLALAKKGIENAGGNIWFESKKNEGTTFFISMPLADS